MEDKMHEVVQLLLARMKSHPEEFGANDPHDTFISQTENDRWWQARTLVMEYGTEEERAAITAAMREIKLKVAHEWMMDELCNGEERRRKQQEDDEYERGLLNKANNNMGKALRAAIAPALQRIDEQTLSVGTVSPSTKLHVSTIKKALGI